VNLAFSGFWGLGSIRLPSGFGDDLAMARSGYCGVGFTGGMTAGCTGDQQRYQSQSVRLRLFSLMRLLCARLKISSTGER
jgi:hypothetical protein